MDRALWVAGAAGRVKDERRRIVARLRRKVPVKRLPRRLRKHVCGKSVNLCTANVLIATDNQDIFEMPQSLACACQQCIADGGFPDYDCEAAVAVLLGAVVHYRVEEATFGAPPADVDEERFVETWVDVCMRLAESA